MAQRRAGETRDRILAVSLDLFTANGYDATGVADICLAAGVSKGAFYHHFSSKQAAFLALLEEWLVGLDVAVEAADRSDAPAPERLMTMAAIFEQAFRNAAGRLPMFLEFWRQAAREPEVWQATIAPYRRFRDVFARIAADGVAEGSLKPVDPQTAGETLVALGVGLILQAALDAEGADWGRVARDSVQLLLGGVAAAGAAART